MEFDYILTVCLENGEKDTVQSPINGAKTVEAASKAVLQEIVDKFTTVMEAGAIFTLRKHDEGVVISWNTKFITRIATQIVEREEKKDD